MEFPIKISSLFQIKKLNLNDDGLKVEPKWLSDHTDSAGERLGGYWYRLVDKDLQLRPSRDNQEYQEGEDEDEEATQDESKKDFDYILSMPIWNLTM